MSCAVQFLLLKRLGTSFNLYEAQSSLFCTAPGLYPSFVYQNHFKSEWIGVSFFENKVFVAY